MTLDSPGARSEIGSLDRVRVVVDDESLEERVRGGVNLGLYPVITIYVVSTAFIPASVRVKGSGRAEKWRGIGRETSLEIRKIRCWS